MIKVAFLPNYYLFGDLHTAGIFPSTLLLGRHAMPSPSWKRAVDLMFPKQIDSCSVRCPQGFQIWEGVWRGIPIPKKKEDI